MDIRRTFETTALATTDFALRCGEAVLAAALSRTQRLAHRIDALDPDSDDYQFGRREEPTMILERGPHFAIGIGTGEDANVPERVDAFFKRHPELLPPEWQVPAAIDTSHPDQSDKQ